MLSSRFTDTQRKQMECCAIVYQRQRRKVNRERTWSVRKESYKTFHPHCKPCFLGGAFALYTIRMSTLFFLLHDPLEQTCTFLLPFYNNGSPCYNHPSATLSIIPTLFFSGECPSGVVANLASSIVSSPSPGPDSHCLVCIVPIHCHIFVVLTKQRH